MFKPRDLTLSDRLCLSLDVALRTLAGRPQVTSRPHPAAGSGRTEPLEPSDRHLSSCMMRVNHCGEVCAQGLYQGQALTARLPGVRLKMERAAAEENDHLDWCRSRLLELNSHTSYFDPLFYLGSLALGAAAGLAGDRWSLGFVAQTEQQVVRHLHDHLQRLPLADHRSRAILRVMQDDERRHAIQAEQAGAARLPPSVSWLMGLSAKVMTQSTYHF